MLDQSPKRYVVEFFQVAQGLANLVQKLVFKQLHTTLSMAHCVTCWTQQFLPVFANSCKSTRERSLSYGSVRLVHPGVALEKTTEALHLYEMITKV